MTDDARHSEALEALRTAYTTLTREGVASALTVSPSTLKRWEDCGEVEKPGMVIHAVRNLLNEAKAQRGSPGDFTFIDLFAGIGGTRKGFERAGGECVFTSEYDKYSVKTYTENFKPTHPIVGDITAVTRPKGIDNDGGVIAHIRSVVPDHDVLVAGFPCQPFSIAGVSKKNALGHAHGFACETQGTLFFDICRILQARRPTAFMLENVRNLRSHDKGRTFSVIMNSLRELGYEVTHHVIDAKAWVPQHRERIFIVGFYGEKTAFDWEQVKVPPEREWPKLKAILHNGKENPDGRYVVRRGRVGPQYTLTEHLWNYLQAYAKKHQEAGNGFGFGRVGPKQIARTLSARYYKDGSEILIDQGELVPPRRLTPRECARLMGWKDDELKIVVSDTQAYKQFGNSVVVPVVEAVAKAMKPHVIALRAKREARQVGLPV
jgi:DNA (cytosine-5)-methyltransferase 1